MRARSNDPLDAHVPERTCILSRRTAPREELIRLALGPNGEVAPDVRARAPGRGAWIGVSRAELDQANAKGKLKPALQRALKTNELQVPADLGERTEQALRRAALDRLGMEARAGNLINGAERVETAARAGKAHMLVHAADAGEDGRKALDQAWRVGGGGPQGMIFPEGRTILSMALGRENVVHAALTDPAAASRVSHAIARWRAFTGPDRGLEGGEPALRTGSADEDLTKE
ncbi:DUF448 domain-containing protein [Sphingomonas hankyongi]|uniref:DUF448 domain-containing protein n=1 Tax=Sphingomonas hankyongi TaxID=2908209 RepID=A0ABT0S1C5_9SPHN|nr:DUF448 domain-containing protein [Sphingomonas hankyongi]MCL6729654.1 DUF448 domain-containing protein [Sphingomonas hankyongi]